jgi:CelD/BcsL family acetyltransferase involved in cellulose biosynthesis
MGRGVELVPVATEDAWQELLDRVPGATAFHEWKWLTTVSAALSVEFLAMAAERRGERFAAVPLLVRRRGPLRTVNWVPFPYVGPLARPDMLRSCLGALSTWQTRGLVALHQASFAPGIEPGAAAFAGTSFTPSIDDTLVVRADSLETARRNLNSSTRNKLNKASRLGVEIEPLSETGARTIATILADAFERRGLRCPYPESTGIALWTAYRDDPRARLAQATINGDVVGVQLTVTRGLRAYLWFAGTDETGRAAGAGVALYWDAIAWSVSRQFELDLVGAPDEGIRRYKQQFGAESVPFVVARSTLPGYLSLQRLANRVRHK